MKVNHRRLQRRYRFFSLVVGGFVLSLALPGCSWLPKNQMGEPVVEATDKAPVSTAELAERRKNVWINNTLAEAEMALVSNRLMRPKEDNAYSRYREILDIAPDNADAKIGVKRISRRYLVLAKEAFDHGSYARAEDFLARSKALQPDYVGAAAMTRYFAHHKSVAANEYLLEVTELTARDDAIKVSLEKIAALASQWQSRLLIVSRNDAEGRWIYQQLKEMADGYRFRANIEHGQPPRIVLLDQPLQ
ncbi:hypothetical protein EDC56_1964 [Sinobacterium caligoides]|uniref:Tetratricopeptide repeat protein n=1 Tax=Sinobacterium caligoides TaxID=933926 RepID=A0A3N2DP87_9GAMM|nr:hypothetical protein [Sinobacterium caligoides]ROS01522.1 hypothetical protein EDC56_1964 [Sinobacterium caligoides]